MCPQLSILIVTPAPKGSLKGNRITANRWENLLTDLGHHPRVSEDLDEEAYDVLVALHARKSHNAIARSKTENPSTPVILTLTGTDLYGDILTDAQARNSLEMADRLIVLQRMGSQALPEHLRSKVHVIYQSVEAPLDLPSPAPDRFDVCVVGHLREVKDPFRTAEAARLLPEHSKIQILQMGGALSEEMAQQASQEMSTNPRYQWLGELPWEETMKQVAQCHLLSLTSQLEGGANAVGEAIACSVPVISSKIDGSIGMLGEDYPGYFPVGDTEALARLLQRAESDRDFYADLKSRCDELKPLFDPQRERESWAKLLEATVQ